MTTDPATAARVRLQLAASALTGMLANPDQLRIIAEAAKEYPAREAFDVIPKTAVAYADATLAALAATPAPAAAPAPVDDDLLEAAALVIVVRGERRPIGNEWADALNGLDAAVAAEKARRERTAQ